MKLFHFVDFNWFHLISPHSGVPYVPKNRLADNTHLNIKLINSITAQLKAEALKGKNSLAVLLPASCSQILGIENKHEILQVTIETNQLVIRRSDQERK